MKITQIREELERKVLESTGKPLSSFIPTDKELIEGKIRITKRYLVDAEFMDDSPLKTKRITRLTNKIRKLEKEVSN